MVLSLSWIYCAYLFATVIQVNDVFCGCLQWKVSQSHIKNALCNCTKIGRATLTCSFSFIYWNIICFIYDFQLKISLMMGNAVSRRTYYPPHVGIVYEVPE